MRKAAWLLVALAWTGCSGSSNTTDGGSTGGLQDGVVLQPDRTRLLFGLDFGDAVLLGTSKPNTLQLISKGKQDLQVQKAEIISGTDTDGGPLNDPSVFTIRGATFPMTLKGGETGFVEVDYRPTQMGYSGAILRITSNDPHSPTDIVLSGDCVTPRMTVYGGQTTLTLPQVTLLPNDAGGGYRSQYTEGDVVFVNTGTANLIFKTPATIDGDAGENWVIRGHDSNGFPTYTPGVFGPDPAGAPLALSDGGPDLIFLGDGGILGAARVRVGYLATQPGSFTTHVHVASDNAPLTPQVDITVHATATAP